MAFLWLCQPARVVPAGAGESEAGDGAATNALIFKKRPRRQYTSAITLNAPDAAVSTPVEIQEETRKPVMDAMESTAAPVVGRNSAQSMMQIAPGAKRKATRSHKDREEEDWLLTPQQRIQKEIDILSGKEEEEEDKESYGWLADEVESIREEKVKERDRRKQQEQEEAEAEEIAAIMGRGLPGGQALQRSPGLMRDDQGRLQMPAGSEQRRSFGANATNTVSAPALRVRTDDGTDRGLAAGGEGGGRGPGAGAAAEPPTASAASGASGPRNELQRLNERYAGAAAERGPEGRGTSEAREGAEGTPGGESRTDRTTGAPQVSTGITSPFAWNPSSGGGYAGLPASVAPSIMPAPGGGAAAGMPRSGWTVPSGAAGAAGASTPGAGFLSGSRWTTPPAAASPNLTPSPAGGAGLPGVTTPLRTPFMNPMTPGLQGGAGYGTFPARRP